MRRASSPRSVGHRGGGVGWLSMLPRLCVRLARLAVGVGQVVTVHLVIIALATGHHDGIALFGGTFLLMGACCFGATCTALVALLRFYLWALSVIATLTLFGSALVGGGCLWVGAMLHDEALRAAGYHVLMYGFLAALAQALAAAILNAFLGQPKTLPRRVEVVVPRATQAQDEAWDELEREWERTVRRKT